MRTKDSAICVLIILSVLSCVREKADVDEDVMTFYADATGTRTELQSDGAVYWSPKDEIAVYHYDYHGRFASTNTEPSATVEFRGILPDFVRNSNLYYYAFYPYSKDITTSESQFGIDLPSEQIAVEGSFADDLFISAARTKDDKLHFHNVCGGVKFSVAKDGIKKVVFKANAGEPITGKLFFEFDSQGIPVVSKVEGGSSSVTLTAPDNTTFQKGKWYYLVLAPGTLKRGYTIEFYAEEIIGQVSSGNAVQIKRSIWGVLAGLEPENAFLEGSIETSESQLSFYSVKDQSITKSLQITNTGKNPVTIHSVSFDGPFSSDIDSGITIGTGGKLTMNVTFTPASTTTGTGKMTIVYGASQNLDVNLSYSAFAYGIAHESEDFNVSFYLSSDCTIANDKGYYEFFYNFEYVPVGDTEDSYISVENKGNSDIRVIAFGNSDGFYLNKSNEPVDLIVSPGREKGLSFYFSPTEKKNYSGVFNVIAFDVNDPNSNYWCFPYYVQGISKDITALYLSKKSIEFSHLLAGYETESATVQVRNQGDYPAEITVVCPDGFSVSENHFTLDACKANAQYIKDLTVTFNPKHAGTYSGKIVFEGDNLYYGPFEIEVTGTGFALQKDFANFGSSVLWAGCNLGASTPTGYGDYYAWGETTKKSSYSLDNYVYYDSASGQYTKYTNNNKYETLESTDDVASQKNPNWKIPSYNDWRDMIDRTSSRLITIDGVKGLLVVGSRDPYKEQAIFFPFAGGYDGTSLESRGVQGFYWTSTSYNKTSVQSYWIEDGTKGFSWHSVGKYFGFSIRPVYDGVPVSSIVFDEASVKLMEGSMLQLNPQVLPANAQNKELTWSSSNESVATVTSSGFVKGVSAGSATITATSVGSGVKASCVIVVTPVAIPEMVDLGLSVKWASFNVGAYSPEQTGDYYAWGETEPKEYYDWASYKWTEGNSRYLTKYCPDSSYGYNGYSDLKKTLEAEDDVAHVRLGGKWRMPTKAEWDELYNKCKWVSGTCSGVDGYYIYSTASNTVSIFIPDTGYRYDGNLKESGSSRLWSSSICSYYSAHCLNTSYSSKIRTEDRYCGLTVRAVSD